MLGNKTQNGDPRIKRNLIFLNINKGRLEHIEPDGGKTFFDFVEGKFSRIVQKERNFHGERVLYWYVNFDEPNSNDTYSLAFPYSSNVFKSVILALATATPEELENNIIRVEPWLKGEYTNVTLETDGRRLDWITKDLPEIKNIYIGGKTVKDDSARMELITKYVNTINERRGLHPSSGRTGNRTGVLFP